MGFKYSSKIFFENVTPSISLEKTYYINESKLIFGSLLQSSGPSLTKDSYVLVKTILSSIYNALEELIFFQNVICYHQHTHTGIIIINLILLLLLLLLQCTQTTGTRASLHIIIIFYRILVFLHLRPTQVV